MPTDPSPITYAIEPTLSLSDFKQIMRSSGMADRRPMDDTARMQRIIDNSNFWLVARSPEPSDTTTETNTPGEHDTSSKHDTVNGEDAAKGKIIGMCRCLTDDGFCCYVADVNVDAAWQGRGVGRELMRRLKERMEPEVSVFLQAGTAGAIAFYERIGMPRSPRSWFSFERTKFH